MIKLVKKGLGFPAAVTFYKLNGLNFSPANNISTGFIAC
ncbi:MAG: hypothetical protein JWP44_1452 [Mucilaginibacter sp.]|nr:hypothetical protein [Mucilaginibacter sp.]